MNDRTVHAFMADGSEIVRYNRAGKWYREWPVSMSKSRQRLSISQAVSMAREEDSMVCLGRPGGLAFDHRVRKQRQS